MREKHQKQMPLMTHIKDHPQSKELEIISAIIDKKPIISEMVLQDLTRGKSMVQHAGAKGMTADQVVRSAVVKTLYNFTYQELAFHIVDSQSLRWFCRIGIGEEGFKKSTLNRNIKSISDQTWEKVNRCLVEYAVSQKIEKGRQVRIDCTCVETNIHQPSDSSLLYDGVRVLTRLILQAKAAGVRVPGFSNHQRRAKRRMLAIMNAKNQKQRKAAYMDLLKMAENVLDYARATERNMLGCFSLTVFAISEAVKHNADLMVKVIDQTRRRVLLGEKVPAREKVVSIFEPHTDIIIKDRRETIYGHKICLTGGASNLILDCRIFEGNPPDSSLTISMLERQKDIYGRYPLKASLDGGFASKTNLKQAKGLKIKDICFSKRRGLEKTDMCRSEYVYNRLRRFRAGIEAGISWLKRCMGLSRCTWKGWHSFKSYVWSSIVAANLLTLARAQAPK